MKIYVSGKFSGDQIVNVAAAIDAAETLANAGAIPFVPHLSITWQLRHNHNYEWWIKWCLQWVTACDALVRLPGDSPGADEEVAAARELGIPVYYGLEEALVALGEQRCK